MQLFSQAQPINRWTEKNELNNIHFITNQKFNKQFLFISRLSKMKHLEFFLRLNEFQMFFF